MDKNDVGSIGGRIRKVRLDSGLTQKAFGIEIGISLPTVNRIEQNQRSPHVELLIDISRKFSINLNWLLTGIVESKGNIQSGSHIPLFSRLSENLIEDAHEDVEALLTLPDVPPNAVSCRCSDDAYAPEINSGDIVIFVPGDCEPGDTVVVCDRWGNGLVRKMQRQDENVVYVPSRSTYELLADDQVLPLGIVLGVFKRLSKI